MKEALPVRLSISVLLVRGNEPPMSWHHIEGLMTGAVLDGRPIDVTAIAGTPYFRVLNGRHRLIAAMVLGHQSVPCRVLTPGVPSQRHAMDT